MGSGHLVFRREYEPQRVIFYGPKMPFAPGEYDVRFSFDSSADEGVVLGMLHVETDWNAKQGPVYPVVAGRPLYVHLDVTNNLPVNLLFDYFGNADMTVDHVEFTRKR